MRVPRPPQNSTTFMISLYNDTPTRQQKVRRANLRCIDECRKHVRSRCEVAAIQPITLSPAWDCRVGGRRTISVAFTPPSRIGHRCVERCAPLSWERETDAFERQYSRPLGAFGDRTAFPGGSFSDLHRDEA